MLDATKDARSPTVAKRSATELVRRAMESGRPVVLTIDGEAELVVEDAGSYRKLFDLVDRLEAIEGIRRGLEEADAGEGRPAEEVLEELIREYGIRRGG